MVCGTEYGRRSVGRDSLQQESGPDAEGGHRRAILPGRGGRSACGGPVFGRAFFRGWRVERGLGQPKEISKKRGQPIWPRRRGREKKSRVRWREADQRHARIEDGPRCTTVQKGQRQRSQALLRRSCADGESERAGGGWANHQGYGNGRTALDMLGDVSGDKRVTVGTDKAYD